MLPAFGPRVLIASVLLASSTLALGFTPISIAGAGPVALAVEVDATWLDRLSKEDRAAVDFLIGYAPPQFSEDLKWNGAEKPDWKSLRGKVVLLQSWNSRGSGRGAIAKLADQIKDFKPEDVVAIALHTPEGADRAEALFRQKPPETSVAIDPSGAFCDALGVFKRPVNILVDRNGTVRYAGLNQNGLEKALAALVNETADPAAEPRTRSTEVAAPAGGSVIEFPKHTQPVGSANDLRGQAAPSLSVDTWVTNSDEPRGRLLVVDFFATWCGPCMAAVPHMNDLSTRHSQDICVIALTDESSKSAVEEGLYRRRMKPADFRYSIGVDPRGRMKNGFGVRDIPHIAIISSDNIVRWQGHPSLLNDSVLSPLVAANKALLARTGAATDAPDDPRNRWAGERRKR